MRCSQCCCSTRFERCHVDGRLQEALALWRGPPLADFADHRFAYESIAKGERAALHELFGAWLERTGGERAIEYEEVLGYHLEQAYRCQVDVRTVDDRARPIGREAAVRLGSAGRRAFLRGDAPAGANLISRAVAMLGADDHLRVELIPNTRLLQGMNLDLAWADRVLTEAVEAAAPAGDRLLAAPPNESCERGTTR